MTTMNQAFLSFSGGSPKSARFTVRLPQRGCSARIEFLPGSSHQTYIVQSRSTLPYF